MCGHENDPAASAQTFEIVFESIVNDELRDVAFVQFREMGELDQEPSHILKTSSKNPLLVAATHFRKNHSKIVEAGAPLPSGEMKSKPGQRLTGSVSDAARHGAEQFNERESKHVFRESFNASAHPWYFCILLPAGGSGA